MFILFFFFKQKTAYEMRISDWSSDVCSSDLRSTNIRCRTIWRISSPRRGYIEIGGRAARPLFPEQAPHRVEVGKGLVDELAHQPQLVAGDGEEHDCDRPDDDRLDDAPALFLIGAADSRLVVDPKLALVLRVELLAAVPRNIRQAPVLGSASCREGVFPSVYISVVHV